MRHICPACNHRNVYREQRHGHVALCCNNIDCKAPPVLVNHDGTPWVPRPVLNAPANGWKLMAAPSGGHRAL